MRLFIGVNGIATNESVCIALLHEPVHRRPLIANIKAYSAVTAANAQTRCTTRRFGFGVHDFIFRNTLVCRNDTNEKSKKKKSIFGVGSEPKTE